MLNIQGVYEIISLKTIRRKTVSDFYEVLNFIDTSYLFVFVCFIFKSCVQLERGWFVIA